MVNPPGSTLVTHMSSFRVPFSTLGNALASGLSFATFSVRGSFQLYICNLDPDEPASMTIPKWRPESHESTTVGGAIPSWLHLQRTKLSVNSWEFTNVRSSHGFVTSRVSDRRQQATAMPPCKYFEAVWWKWGPASWKVFIFTIWITSGNKLFLDRNYNFKFNPDPSNCLTCSRPNFRSRHCSRVYRLGDSLPLVWISESACSSRPLQRPYLLSRFAYETTGSVPFTTTE